MTRGRTFAATAALLLAAVTGGCGWISPNSIPSAEPTGLPSAPTPTVTAEPALATLVPEDISDRGVLRLVTDPEYAPMEFTVGDNLEIVGVDIDLGNAIAAKLGLRAEWSGVAFSRLLPSVSDDPFDAAMSALTITPEREQQVTMVSYLSAGTAWAVATGNPNGIRIDDACGRRVAVQEYTVQADDLRQRSDTCTAAGKPAIAVEYFAVHSAAKEALAQGRVDALVADSPVVAYAVAGNPDAIEQLGEPYDEALLGIAVDPADQQLAAAIQRAVQVLIDGGEYTAILDRWGLADNTITTVQVNSASE